MKDLKKALNHIEKRIRNIETNLREMAGRPAPKELDFQANQLRKIADDLGKLDFPQTNIHGTGTGTE
jgi:hypothetical protein